MPSGQGSYRVQTSEEVKQGVWHPKTKSVMGLGAQEHGWHHGDTLYKIIQISAPVLLYGCMSYGDKGTRVCYDKLK